MCVILYILVYTSGPRALHQTSKSWLQRSGVSAFTARLKGAPACNFGVSKLSNSQVLESMIGSLTKDLWVVVYIYIYMYVYIYTYVYIHTLHYITFHCIPLQSITLHYIHIKKNIYIYRYVLYIFHVDLLWYIPLSMDPNLGISSQGTCCAGAIKVTLGSLPRKALRLATSQAQWVFVPFKRLKGVPQMVGS